MVWRWVCGILAALLVLLCMTRVRLLGAVKDGAVTLDVRFGLFRFRLLPGKKKTAEETKQAAAAQKKADASADKEKDGVKLTLSKETLASVRDAAQALWPPLKRALTRTRRGVRIHPLTLSLILGGQDDPAATAVLYGRLHAGMWTLMPMLEEVLIIPDPHLHIGMDFNTEKTDFEGTFGLSARFGTLAHIGFGVAIPVLRWFLRNRKKEQTRPVKNAA